MFTFADLNIPDFYCSQWAWKRSDRISGLSSLTFFWGKPPDPRRSSRLRRFAPVDPPLHKFLDPHLHTRAVYFIHMLCRISYKNTKALPMNFLESQAARSLKQGPESDKVVITEECIARSA
jgi:hypothetical protein